MNRTVATLLILALAAGCTGKAPAPLSGGPSEAATTAPLQGWVFDPAQDPIPNTNVSLYGTNQSVLTSEDGRYAFQKVPRGTPLVLIAEAKGFLTSSKSITVPEAEAATLNFTLDPVPVKEPRRTITELPGFLSCQAFFVADQEETRHECGSTDTNNKPRRDFTLQEDVAGIVLELVWEKGTPLAETLNLTVETVGAGDQDTILSAAVGPSPLKAQVSEQAARRFYSQGGIARVIVSAGAEPDEDEASVGISVAAQQGFVVYASIFYVAPPPTTYTALDK